MSNQEAPFSYTAKINGELFTVRGDDNEQFINNLAWAATNIGQILEATNLIAASGIANDGLNRQPVQAQAQATPAPSAWSPAPTPPPTFTQAAVSAPSCIHGPRSARSGVGAKGPWRAWMCPTPKGTPDQCAPEWVRSGSPEWASFPA